MTKTEVLLILLGGIFVVEALSVLIQVFSLPDLPQARVPDGADPPPLRADGLVGDEDHPALLDHRRDLRGDRLHDLPAVGRVSRGAAGRCRAGPVPRRRAGALGRRAALRRCAARGRGGRRRRRRRARRSAAPDGVDARRRRARRGSSTPRAVVKSPGRAARGAGDRRRARARASRCSASSSWRGGCSPNAVRRGHRARTARRRRSSCSAHIHRDGGRAASRWPATSARPLTLARRRARRPTRSSSARPPRSSSRTRVAFAPEAAVLLNLEPDHLDRHGTLRGLPRGQAAGLRAPGRRRRRGRAAARRRDLGGCARRGAARRLGAAPDSRWAGSRSPTIRLRGAAQPRATRVAAAASPGARDRPRGGARRRCGPSPASRTASRRSPSRDGVLYVNDSKATNVASTLVALRLRRRRST